MCGIVGYIGRGQALPVLVEGLTRLEYRGYDSAGVAFLNKDSLEVRKTKGRLANLEAVLEKETFTTHLGIGHTRWATHGAPSDVNAHPHLSSQEKIAVIHNGIIENYMKIKEWLEEEQGIDFRSETDTEVIAHLVEHYYKGDLLDAVYQATEMMEGAYAIGVIALEEPDKIVAVRKDSPLIIGIGEGENFIASDIPALLKYTKDMYLVENDEYVLLKENSIQIFDRYRMPVEREVFKVTWDVEAAEKEGYEHFTLKEIHEQPKGVRETLVRRLNGHDIVLDGIQLTKEDLEAFNRVYIVACGTAYHAGLIAKHAIEGFAKIPVQVEVASEFRYGNPFIDEHTLFIAVSQSGETIDTLQALRLAKEKGARILSVLNVVGSSIARDSHDVLYTWAGPEIGVASTKAYTTQLIAFYLIALKMGELKGTVTSEEKEKLISSLLEMPEKVQQLLDQEVKIQQLASQQFNNEQVFFIGRGADYATALESSLKLKEISYINSFAIQAGELKHGTIALIEEGTLVVAIASQDHLYDKMLSNMKEVKARGAYVVAVAKTSNREVEKVADKVIYIPDVEDELAPLLTVIPMQLFAYYVSLARGNDVDKPRNLAKSVTVE